MDWDEPALMIGSKVRRLGNQPRSNVVKGTSALNAAQRSGGIVGTEKKKTSANATEKGQDQFLTKVDRSDGIIKTNRVSVEQAQALSQARNKLFIRPNRTMTQADLAMKVGVPTKSVQNMEVPNSELPPKSHIDNLARFLNVRLFGANIGQPLNMAKFRREEAARLMSANEAAVDDLNVQDLRLTGAEGDDTDEAAKEAGVDDLNVQDPKVTDEEGDDAAEAAGDVTNSDGQAINSASVKSPASASIKSPASTDSKSVGGNKPPTLVIKMPKK